MSYLLFYLQKISNINVYIVIRIEVYPNPQYTEHFVVTDLFLLQQRQGVSQQSHPEAPGGDLGRHEGEEQLSRLPEALLSVQLVELTVLP